MGNDIKRLNVHVAYPWSLGDENTPEDVTGLTLDEILYPSSLVGNFIIGRDVIGDEI